MSQHSCRLAVIVVAVCWLLGIVLAICLEVLGQDRRPLRDHMCQTSTPPATTPVRRHPTAEATQRRLAL